MTDCMWRTKIVKTFPNGRTTTNYRGPYKAKNAAVAAGNEEKRSAIFTSVEVTIQRAPLVWEDVPS